MKLIQLRFSFLSLATVLFVVLGASFTFYMEVPYNEKRLIEGIVLVLGVGVLCSSSIIQSWWLTIVKEFGQKAIVSLCLFFLIGIVSSVLAVHTDAALLEVSHYFLLFNLIIFTVVGFQYAPRYFEIGLLSVIGVMAGIYLINVGISYLYVFFIPDFPLWPSTDFTRIWFKDIGYRYPEPFSNFVNIRFFNHLQTWTLPLLSLLVVYIPKRQWAFSKIAFIVLCGWWMLVFASDARGTMLSSFIAIGFIFYMYRDKAQEWVKKISYSAIIGFIGYGLFFKLFPLLINTASRRTAFSRYSPGSERLALWENALNVIIENPLFGIGPMHFSEWTDTLAKHPHNIYMQFAGEWGLIGGTLFAGLVIWGLYSWFKKSDRLIKSSEPNSPETLTRVTLTASLLAALIHGLVSGIINTPISQIMMVLVIGWMVGLSITTEKNKEENFSSSLVSRISLIGINLLAAGFLIWSYSIQVPNLDENRQQYLELIENEVHANRLSPRYWDQGVIGLPERKVDK
ncbi:O-antigen ligase family protein [Fodinibius sp. SL11]|uniref:O-antigen ligase family protein n=1 Tax=Fodinibius sp. SL11 TaxID=3425690 RepID=UPI003F884258